MATSLKALVVWSESEFHLAEFHILEAKSARYV